MRVRTFIAGCALAVALGLLVTSGLATERLLFDDEITLTAKETTFQPRFTDLTTPVDFRAGTVYARYEILRMAAAGPTVAPDAASYTVTIPATGHRQQYQTRLDK